jgi:glycine/D-amino acid oxidase-like deaminating enzyme
VHGYWAALPNLAPLLGHDRALDVARLGTKAQDALREFATAPGRNVSWREDGYLRVSASRAQDTKLAPFLTTAQRLGIEGSVQCKTRQAVAKRCDSTAFRRGLLFAEGATVDPAKLADALRAAVIEAGVIVYEQTTVKRIDRGRPLRVSTEHGAVIAREVILANYTGLMSLPEVRSSTTLFSSFPVMSNPAPEALEAIGWSTHLGMADLRLFQHYFRRTPDGRVLMGAGSGPLALGSAHGNQRLRRDEASWARAGNALRRFFPRVAAAGIARSWGWPIEVSSDRLPFFGTLANSGIHYGSGYSGHGINPSYIGGQCLASLALGTTDEWTNSAFCKRARPSLPVEPLRYIGGVAIRWGIVACEDADDIGASAPYVARVLAGLPQKLGLRIGSR